jgi:negative regulator of flagellin synthesis FlgM
VSNKIGGSGVDKPAVQVGNDRTVKHAKTGSGPAPTAAPSQPASPSGGVQITDSARQLAALERAIREVPDIDENKVAQVRAAIAQGSYDVSPERIADKLIRMENELR